MQIYIYMYVFVVCAIVMEPTRELAVQAQEQFTAIATGAGMIAFRYDIVILWKYSMCLILKDGFELIS